MTREEAIEVLKDWDGYFIGHSSDDVCDALEMAIKALEQEPVLDKIKSEIEQFAKNPNFGDLSTGASCGALKAIEIIDKYKAEGSDKE